MVNIPGSVAIKSVLKPGVVFYFSESSFSSPLPHYFVVLNYNPLEDKLLLLVNVTSQIDSREQARSNVPSKTLVCISPSKCSFLTCDSIFDCNSPILRSICELVSKYDGGQLKLVDSVPNDVLSAPREGVLASPLLNKETKDLARIID